MPRPQALVTRLATHLALASDVWSPWSTFDSPRFARWHAQTVNNLADGLQPQAIRLGSRLDWRRPPWLLELVRNHSQPHHATQWALRPTWDHAVSDVEGMLLALQYLSAPTSPEPDPHEPPQNTFVSASHPNRTSVLQAFAKRLATQSHRHTVQAGPGTTAVDWTWLADLADLQAASKRAAHHGLSMREFVLLVSVQAFQRYQQACGSPCAFDVLCPSYSLRAQYGTAPELGNHFRRAVRFSFEPNTNLIPAIRRQSQTGHAIPYRAYGVLGRLPAPLARKVLRRLPPLIVNWDDPHHAERFSQIAGAQVQNIALAAPLLPYQHCSFIWWVRGGQLHCSLTTDRALVPEVTPLVAALRQTLAPPMY